MTAPLAPSPRRHRLFQLHLSTCVVLMVVAGAFVGLNLYPNPPGQMRTMGLALDEVDYYGWPLCLGYHVIARDLPAIYGPQDPITPIVEREYFPDYWRWDLNVALPVNIVFFVVVLAACAFLMERALNPRPPGRTRVGGPPPHA
ncbi:MAG: hypothetical protein L6R28_13540 [Planctomycetes bacterium]|nr:hypothetical protein [Planctomycetota bacterium]